MESLKRSEKLCPECKIKNAIRSFNCKGCNFLFPKKEKQSKEDHSQYLTIKSFLTPANKQESSHAMTLNLGNKSSENSLTCKLSEVVSKILNTKNSEDQVIQIENKITLDEFNHLRLEDWSLRYQYSCDFNKIENTIFGAVAFYDEKLNTIVLNFLSFNFISEDKEISSDTRIIFNNKTILPQYENEIDEISRFSIKFIPHTSFVLYSVNNLFTVYFFDQNKISKMGELVMKNYISKFDAQLINNTNENLQFQIILSDYENKIYLYSFLNSNFSLISIYEDYYNYKITDLKFLPIIERIKVNDKIKNKYYFSACSRDGTIKIFDTFNPFNFVFCHKSSELWITQLFYDRRTNILFYLVNSNSNEKIVSIKFFENGRDFSIKRIHETENTTYLQLDHVSDKAYYIKANGSIKYINLSSVEEMHVYHRSKKNKVVHKYLIEKNAEENSSGLNDETYSKFFLFNSPTSNRILLLPGLDRIKVIKF